MTGHNQKIFDGMIEKLEQQRLRLFRSAAQLDTTIRELRTDMFCTSASMEPEYISECIKARMTHREAFLCAEALPRDEMSSEIMQDAIDNFE